MRSKPGVRYTATPTDTSPASPSNTVAAAAVRPATPGEEAKEFSINIEGLGRSNSAVSEFVLRLESLGLFDSVVLQKGTRETFLSGEAVAFRIQCGIKADGGAK